MQTENDIKKNDSIGSIQNLKSDDIIIKQEIITNTLNENRSDDHSQQPIIDQRKPIIDIFKSIIDEGKSIIDKSKLKPFRRFQTIRHKILTSEKYQEQKLIDQEKNKKLQLQKNQSTSKNENVVVMNDQSKNNMDPMKKKNSNNIFQIYYLKHFVYQLKTHMGFKMYNMLQAMHMNIIYDVSHNKISQIIVEQNHKIKGITQKIFTGKNILQKLTKFLEIFPLIIPNSKGYLFWNFIVLCAIISNLVMYTIDFVLWENNFNNNNQVRWKQFNITMLTIYIFDTFVKLNTQRYQKGLTLIKKQDISINYFENEFLNDITSMIPVIVEISSYGYVIKYWYIFVFLKLKTYQKITHDISNIFIIEKQFIKFLTIIKLALFISFVAHIFGCAWYGLATYCRDQNIEVVTWLEKKEMLDSNWEVGYVWAFYFAITTMTTIGYGDITPSNTYEVSLLIVGMLVATFTFATTFNAIGCIVQEAQNENLQYQNETKMINVYLQNKNCPDHLVYKIQNHLEEKFKESKKLSYEEQKRLVAKLPEKIQESVIFESFLHILVNNKNIFGQFSLECQMEIASRFQEKIMHKGHIIYNDDVGQPQDPCFYHIESGKVVIYVGKRYDGAQNHNNYVKYLEKNQYFGEQSFFTGQNRENCVQTLHNTVLNYIKRSDFIDALRLFPFDYEIFCMMKDKIVYNQNNSQLNIGCISCKKLGHSIKKCPLLHYQPDHEKIVLKYIYGCKQSSKPDFVRQGRLRWNSLLDQNYINEKIQKYNQNSSEKKIITNLKVLSEESQESVEEKLSEEENKSIEVISETKRSGDIESVYLDEKNILLIQSIEQDEKNKDLKLTKKQSNKSQRSQKNKKIDHLKIDSQQLKDQLPFLIKFEKEVQRVQIPIQYQKIFHKLNKKDAGQKQLVAQKYNLTRFFSRQRTRNTQGQSRNFQFQIQNQDNIEIDQEDEPIQFLYYYPTSNFDAENIVKTYEINKKKYKDITGFGVYTFFRRRIVIKKPNKNMFRTLFVKAIEKGIQQ